MWDDTIVQLRRAISDVLDPVFADHSTAALLDFPSSVNVGDSAIWLGEERYLNERGISVSYRSDSQGYSKDTLRKRVGDGIICLHGGGNFGDIWEGPQDFRERVIRDFPDHSIVIFPQTIHFNDPARLERVSAIFAKHGGLTVVARSRNSFHIAQEALGCKVLMAPDMAFMLRRLPGRTKPIHDIVWLRRKDSEAADYAIPQVPDAFQVDWAGLGMMQRANHVLKRKRRWGSMRSVLRQGLDVSRHRCAVPISRTFHVRAQRRLAKGIRILSAGRVVITDRLHGHILCLLLEIPHVLMENSYGKLGDFHETWTHSSLLCQPAATPREALDLARGLYNNIRS